VYLAGISMGGAVAMTAAAALTPEELAGLILITPAVWGREVLPWTHTALLWAVSHGIPALPLTGRGLNRQPTDNIDLLRRLWKDPHMTRSVRADMIHGTVDLMDDALAVAPRLTGRVLILTAGNDEIIPTEPLSLLQGRLPKSSRDHQRWIRYDKGYHMLIRGLNGPEVRNDIARWIIEAASATVVEENKNGSANAPEK
jgi:alpha-beta hydrolase superfamily lysophospholipase